jgi:amidase
MTDLWRRSATDLVRMIAARETSSAEVVEAHLERIAAVNGKLNAIVRVLADEARAGAKAADEQVAAGASLGPLHGVPITVKENLDMKGLPTTSGVIPLADAVAPGDAPVVERMRAAGAIPIGRTNLPDLGLRVHTDSSLHGLTRNPWDQTRTAGGSSGGEASALASGMSPLGLGNDIGGSLRNPANACGIASIRPSLGRVPDAGFGPAADRMLAVQLMAVHGPMARRVADVRLGLKILSGAHPRDPWSLDVPFEGRPIEGPIRVAVVAAPPGGDIDRPVKGAVLRAADALANAGYEVVEACPASYEQALDVWRRFLLGDFALDLPNMAPLMGADGRAFLDAINAGTTLLEDPLSLSRLMVARDSIARDWSMFMADHPLILSPTWTSLPFVHGYDLANPEKTIALMRPVVPANLLGLPSACVSAGRAPASGLPMGVLLTGRWMRDDLCLDAAEVVEARLGLETPIDPAW